MTNCVNPVSVISAATDNAQALSTGNVKGRVVLLQATNSGAGWAYLKIYDLNRTPNPATDVPKLRIGLPPGSGTIAPFEFSLSQGLAIVISGGSADTDTTAVALGQVLANFLTP